MTDERDPSDSESPPLTVAYVVLVVVGLLIPMLAVAWLNVAGPRNCKEVPGELR